MLEVNLAASQSDGATWRRVITALGVVLKLTAEDTGAISQRYTVTEAYRWQAGDLVHYREIDSTQASEIRVGDVAPFNLLAHLSNGVPRIAVLRMDVDNLGDLFGKGLQRPAGMGGLAVTAALSSALSRFFEGWVGELCRQRNQQGKGGIYAVYSGGDDLFLVGSWHLIPELAQQIRNDFIRYATGTEPYHLRVTLLSAELEQIATDWTLAVLAPLDLDGLAWRITARANSSAEHSWAGSASYQELAQPLLSRPNQLPSVWTFQLASPITFRQRGLNVPLPLLDLVFGSLLEQWNASSELALPDEVRRFAAECPAINRYELRSVASPTSGGVVQIGAVGRCSFRAINLDRYWRACIDVLARFAFFSGIGASTTRGFGQARLLTKTDQPRQREAADNGDPLPD